jgi:hypothetical protein
MIVRPTIRLPNSDHPKTINPHTEIRKMGGLVRKKNRGQYVLMVSIPPRSAIADTPSITEGATVVRIYRESIDTRYNHAVSNKINQPSPSSSL